MKINVTNYENREIARAILGRLMGKDAYKGMKAYHADIFIDYDILASRPNVSGIYIIRDAGTQMVPVWNKEGTKNEGYKSHFDGICKIFGTEGHTAFLIRDRITEKSREIEITEFRLSDPHHTNVAVTLAQDPDHAPIFWADWLEVK